MKHPIALNPSPEADRACHPGRRDLLRSAGLLAAGSLIAPALAHAQPASPLSSADAGAQYAGALSSSQPAIANGVREAIMAALFKVPVVGGVLSYLGGLLIPLQGETPEQRWQRQVGEHVTAHTLALMAADLRGLSAVAERYRSAVSNGNPASILRQSTATQAIFEVTLPRFQLRGQEEALLPLFVVAASLELALLRDMALSGRSLGLQPAEVADLENVLIAKIRDYRRYVDWQVLLANFRVRKVYPNRGTPVTRNNPLQPELRFMANLQTSVMDIRDTWYAFDAARYPGPTRVRLNREIHLMAGWWHQAQNVPMLLPGYPIPKSPIATLELFFSTYRRRNYSAGAIVKYADGSQLRTGSINGNPTRIVVPAGASIDLLRVHYGSVVSQIDARVGRRTHTAGRSDTLVDPITLAPPKHQLSSLRSTGTGRNTNNTHDSGFIAGFQLQQMEAAPISLEAFDDLAPRLAPQLLEWVAS